MATYKTEALVLRSRKYQEADCLLNLLTEKRGKVAAIAKGVRKNSSQLRGGIQLFTHNDMMLYEGRTLHTVTQSMCLEAFTPLQQDVRAIAAACYWSELFDALIPDGGGDADLFRLALAGFHLLSLEVSPLLMRSLEIKLLHVLGYKPMLEDCAACGISLGTSHKLVFSVTHGGVLCPACSRGMKPNFCLESANIWQQVLRMDFSKMLRLRVSPASLEQLAQITEAFFGEQLNYPLKSRILLKELL